MDRGAPMGRLDGVPVTIKDLLITRGWPTLRGSKNIRRDQKWDEDAPAVARLRENGAVVLGKTTSPEFGWKALGDSPLTGITRNPWKTDRTPGGSSAGAAAAAAAGMGALHIGTDGGGSIRIPASFCGIFGLKPTYGRVPQYPPSPFAVVSHAGPMTRSVGDAALMLTVLSGADDRDGYALPHDGRDFSAGLEDGVKGMRLAFSPRLGYAKVDPEIASSVAAAAKVFAELGAHVEETDPGFESPRDAFYVLWASGGAKVVAGFHPREHAAMDPGLVAMAKVGENFSSRDYLDAEAIRAALVLRMNMLSSQIRSAADADRRRAGAARQPGPERSGDRDALDRLDPVQLPLQHDPAARRLCAVRPHQGGVADRAADCRPPE